jgi:O-acetyl-ADP-ribose deacetylase (regulator of RNase III)
MEYRVGDATIELIEGDITRVPVDVVVNAANSSLVGGGGVDGAIHRAGGPEIMADLERRYGRDRHCPTGDAVITTAGRLPARHVVHAVGPRWSGGGRGEDELLASAYRRSLELAAEAGAESVALPSISTGIYGFPVERAAPIALETVRDALSREPRSIRRVVFVLRPDTLPLFERAAERVFGAS